MLEKVVNESFDVDMNVENLIINDIKSVFNDYGNCIDHSSKVVIALKLALEDGE